MCVVFCVYFKMIDETLFLNIDDFITKYDYWSSKVQFINVQHRDEKNNTQNHTKEDNSIIITQNTLAFNVHIYYKYNVDISSE